MKILLAQNMLYVPALGGANKANRCLLEGLAERKHSCRALVPSTGSHGPGTRSQFLHELVTRGIGVSFSATGVDVFNLKRVEVHAVTDSHRLHTHLVRQIREFEPAWTLVTSQDPGQVLLAAALEANPRRVVYVVHATWDLPFGPWTVFSNPSITEKLRHAAGIITVSNYVREYIRRWSGLESVVIPFPVYGLGPFPRFGNFDEGFVGMVNPCAVKGISVFLKVAQALPDFQFAAVPTWGTTSSDRDALERLPNVQLLKPVDNIDEFFARTRVLLVPSLWDEAFGVIVVEAMLRGIPVLASNVGGVPEAKLGIDYVLPVRPISGYEERLDDKNNPVPIVPEQDFGPWLEVLRGLLSDRNRYARLSVDSRDAALAYISTLGCTPFEKFLESLAPEDEAERGGITPQKEEQNAGMDELNRLVDGLSPERRALLAQRLREKRTSPRGKDQMKEYRHE